MEPLLTKLILLEIDRIIRDTLAAEPETFDVVGEDATPEED